MFTDGEIAILCFVVILACYGYPLHKNNGTSFYILLAFSKRLKHLEEFQVLFFLYAFCWKNEYILESISPISVKKV